MFDKQKSHHWYDEDGPLTEEAIQALEDERKFQSHGRLKATIIKNEHGLYVAPAGALPGEGEEYF